MVRPMLLHVEPSYLKMASIVPSSFVAIVRRSAAQRSSARAFTAYLASRLSVVIFTGSGTAVSIASSSCSDGDSALENSGARRYGTRRYWQDANEQFSHGTRSVNLRTRSV